MAILVVLLFCSEFGFGQDIPNINKNDLLDKSDIKKKSGWLILGLDSNFQETLHEEDVIHRQFEFVNLKGQYASTYIQRQRFPVNGTHVYEASEGTDTLHLLNGVLKFYDKQEKLILKYVFKNGFLLNIFEYEWNGKYGGRIKTAIEYIQSANDVELYANYFNSDGNITADSHELNDGVSFITLPGNRTIILR